MTTLLLTVRIATVLYASALALWLLHRDHPARFFWTLACALYLAHVAAAFHFVHHWSHTAAYEHTAQISGWGAGLYINYAFTLLWIVTAIRWWRGHRPTALIQWSFAFMFFNAAIIFGGGFIRWFGIAAGVALAILAASYTPNSRRCSPPQT
jgi:hypothetical protein